MKSYISFAEHKKQLLKDPAVKKTYNDLEEEYALLEEIIKKRIETGITQKELARRMNTKQRAIARLETKGYNPSFQYLRRLTKAFGCKLKIEFV